uniref:PH171R n=1 Tax=African swine fever virus TaxID=10497 RepID=A0A6G7KTY2_ASF
MSCSFLYVWNPYMCYGLYRQTLRRLSSSIFFLLSKEKTRSRHPFSLRRSRKKFRKLLCFYWMYILRTIQDPLGRRVCSPCTHYCRINNPRTNSPCCRINSPRGMLFSHMCKYTIQNTRRNKYILYCAIIINIFLHYAMQTKVWTARYNFQKGQKGIPMLWTACFLYKT